MKQTTTNNEALQTGQTVTPAPAPQPLDLDALLDIDRAKYKKLARTNNAVLAAAAVLAIVAYGLAAWQETGTALGVVFMFAWTATFAACLFVLAFLGERALAAVRRLVRR